MTFEPQTIQADNVAFVYEPRMPIIHAYITPRQMADAIVDRIAYRHNLTLAEIKSATRKRSISRPRQEAFAALKDEMGWGLSHIGRYFDGKDHTTILHGIRAHAKRLEAAQ